MKMPSGDEIMVNATITIRFSRRCARRTKIAIWLLRLIKKIAPFQVVVEQ